MIYLYKCNKCKVKKEIEIPTADIMDSVGRINQNRLEERMYKKRKCECGGNLHKIIAYAPDSLWFEMGIGKGKISQRFK